MVKELYIVMGMFMATFILVGLGIYLGGMFVLTFFKYLIPVVGMILLGKGCTFYLSKKDLK